MGALGRVGGEMLGFLDFEASSLAPEGYPIEVGWVLVDGTRASRLIRPALAWTDWDFTAEAIHGISRARLLAEGTAHEAVARELVDRLSGHAVHVTAPSWDGKWMSVLLRAAGLPRHALRLADAQAAHLAAARDGLRGRVAEAGLEAAAEALVERARAEFAYERVAHRALADAERELRVWTEVRRLAAG